MTTLPVLSRHPETGCLEPRPCAYDGPLPLKVCKRLNRRFIKLDAGRYFYPCDGLDAYNEAIRQTAEAAERIARGKLVLLKASAESYLTGVAFKTLFRYHVRVVMPQRESDLCVEKETAGTEMTVQQLAEALPGEPSARERHDRAAALLEEIYEALLKADRKVAVVAFRAYVEADGNMLEAARIAGLGKTTFYALWPSWLVAARKCS